MAIANNLAKRRAQQRGAALFLVVLVVSLVAAVGVFSMRSASLTSVSAGYHRQTLQAAMLARLAARTAATYVDEHPEDMPPRGNVAGCADDFIAADTSGQAFCAVLKGARVQDYFFAVSDGLPGQLSVADGTGSGISANLSAEMTGASAGQAMSGDDLTEGGVRSLSVTVTGRAMVYPFDPTTTGVCAAGAEESIVEHAVRAHISVPSNG